MLGTPKGVASVLFGEMRDTAQLNAFSAYILEQFFSKSERSGLWRTWGGLHSLFMIGGDAIWGGGNQQDAPDDLENSGKYAPFLEASGGGSAEGSSSSDTETSSSITPNATASQVKDRMMDIIGPYFTSKLEKEYRFEAPDSLADITSSINHSSSWINPLVSPLPRFQNHGDKYNNHHQEKQEQRQQQFKILCMYGVGRPTERKYYYKRDNGDFSIDTSVNDPSSSSSSGLVQNGVLLTDGDATVPLISLGYICVDGWKKSLLLNPSHVDVVTREYRDRELNGVQKLTNLRGGPESADHVDIMGNVKVIEDLLKVVAGVELQDEISSQIHQISRRVKLKYK